MRKNSHSKILKQHLNTIFKSHLFFYAYIYIYIDIYRGTRWLIANVINNYSEKKNNVINN